MTDCVKTLVGEATFWDWVGRKRRRLEAALDHAQEAHDEDDDENDDDQDSEDIERLVRGLGIKPTLNFAC